MSKRDMLIDALIYLVLFALLTVPVWIEPLATFFNWRI